jgi:protease-4
VKKGEHADAFSFLRHLSSKEREKFKEEIKWIYDKFITRVSEGRKLSITQVDSIGQGRIWSGIKAKELGLVDETGGLLRAIEIACEKAKIKEKPKIIVFPKPKKGFVPFF